MKTQHLIGGIFATAALVSTASVFSGAGVRIRQEKKRLKQNIETLQKTTGEISTASQLNKAYKQTMNSLELKAMYEKVNLQTMNSLKKVTRK